MHARARVCRSHRSHIARTTQHRPPLSPLLLHRACPGSCIGPVRSDQLKFKIFHYCFKALQILLVTLYFTHLMACGWWQCQLAEIGAAGRNQYPHGVTK